MTVLTFAALFVAGLIGITLSVPLQAPAVTLFGLAGLLVGGAWLRKGCTQIQPKSLLILVLGSVLYFSLRAVTSPVWDLGVEDLMLILPASILYLVSGYGVGSKHGAKLRQGLAWVIVALLILHIGAAGMQLAGYEGYSLSRYFTSTSRASENTVTGMYGYYGSFANFSVIAGFLCLSMGLWGRFGYGMRVAVFILGVAALVLAIMSGSRSAAVSLVVAFVVFSVGVYLSVAGQAELIRRRAKYGVFVLLSVGLLAGAGGASWVLKHRGAGDGLTAIGFDSGVRIPFWAMAAEQWADHPIVGAGSRSYSYECFRYWNPNLNTGEKNPEFVHNEYLQLLADYGVLGFLLISVLLVWHLAVGGGMIRRLSKVVGDEALKKGSNAMALSIAGMCGIAAMAVHITFDFRTHLLANLLLLVCCAVWVLPLPRVRKDDRRQTTDNRQRKMAGERGQRIDGRQGGRESRMGSWCLGLVMMVLSLGAIGLGGQQLLGGWPLIEHKMAKEDGAWNPSAVSKPKMIAVLEKSVQTAPHYNRYQRLGTLYQLKATNESGDIKEKSIEKAKNYYLKSIKKHPYNPIAKINLASIYAASGEYKLADDYYSSAVEMAKARERWFRMHVAWGDMQLQWAAKLWKDGALEDAEIRFRRAKELYQLSQTISRYYYPKNWVPRYTQVLISHARFLDYQERYDEAAVLYEECREEVKWGNSEALTELDLFYAEHLYDKGRSQWFKRKPDEAYQLMKAAKARLIRYRSQTKGPINQSWHAQLSKIEEVMTFLENAGIGK